MIDSGVTPKRSAILVTESPRATVYSKGVGEGPGGSVGCAVGVAEGGTVGDADSVGDGPTVGPTTTLGVAIGVGVGMKAASGGGAARMPAIR